MYVNSQHQNSSTKHKNDVNCLIFILFKCNLWLISRHICELKQSNGIKILYLIKPTLALYFDISPNSLFLCAKVWVAAVFRRKLRMYEASHTEIIKHFAFYFSNAWEMLINKLKWMENASRADLEAWFSHLRIMWPQASFSFLIHKKKKDDIPWPAHHTELFRK